MRNHLLALVFLSTLAPAAAHADGKQAGPTIRQRWKAAVRAFKQPATQQLAAKPEGEEAKAELIDVKAEAKAEVKVEAPRPETKVERPKPTLSQLLDDAARASHEAYLKTDAGKAEQARLQQAAALAKQRSDVQSAMSEILGHAGFAEALHKQGGQGLTIARQNSRHLLGTELKLSVDAQGKLVFRVLLPTHPIDGSWSSDYRKVADSLGVKYAGARSHGSPVEAIIDVKNAAAISALIEIFPWLSQERLEGAIVEWTRPYLPRPVKKEEPIVAAATTKPSVASQAATTSAAPKKDVVAQVVAKGPQQGSTINVRKSPIGALGDGAARFRKIAAGDATGEVIVHRDAIVTAFLDVKDALHPDSESTSGDARRTHILVIPNKEDAPEKDILAAARKLASDLGVRDASVYANPAGLREVDYLHVHIVGERPQALSKTK
jgi:hypothetical protein